jgi:hypothetical protein
MTEPEQRSTGRRRRRAVGPTGAPSAAEPRLELEAEPRQGLTDDDDRLRRDRPPHHDRGL